MGSHYFRVTPGRGGSLTGSSHGQVPVTLEDGCFFQWGSERLGGLPKAAQPIKQEECTDMCP